MIFLSCTFRRGYVGHVSDSLGAEYHGTKSLFVHKLDIYFSINLAENFKSCASTHEDRIS